MRNDFVVFILTHGRPDRVYTYDTLMKCGYTGRIVFVVDNEDSTAMQYADKYGYDNVYVFDKLAMSKKFDTIDISDDRRCIVYARNASYEIAKELGYKYFLQLDDDYTNFRQRWLDGEGKFRSTYVKNFDAVVDAILDFLERSGAKTVAMAQTGDFIGGAKSNVYKKCLSRKAMNTFFCSTERPIQFIGRINEDVNTYVHFGSIGDLFFTIRDLTVDQCATQANSGGMTDVYKATGTYTKSFFTVICCPSCVKVSTVGTVSPRIHHLINWETAVPKIISDKYRKE